MTDIPADLAGHRHDILALTGLSGDNVGIAPNRAHLASGGYHCGLADCAAIGRFHPPATAHIGSRNEDYSARLLCDRLPGGNTGSAIDIGDNWPNGGRASWLRYNRLLVADLRAGNPALASIRAVNCTLDGTTRLRFDREHGFAQETSTDTVDSHTHQEYYRNTAGQRGAAFVRTLQLMRAAIAGTQPAPNPPTPEDDDMAGWNQPLGQGPSADYAKQYPATALGWTWAGIDRANTAIAVLAQQITALTAAFQAVAGGGTSLDTGAVIAHIDQKTAELDNALSEQAKQTAAVQDALARVMEYAQANLSPAELEALQQVAQPATT